MVEHQSGSPAADGSRSSGHQCNGNEKKGPDSIFALVAWELWGERNARCFRGASAQVPRMLAVLKPSAELWVDAGAKNLGSILHE